MRWRRLHSPVRGGKGEQEWGKDESSECEMDDGRSATGGMYLGEAASENGNGLHVVSRVARKRRG